MFSSRGPWLGSLGSMFCVLSSVSLAHPFAGGTGEPNDPYQIATAAQLVSIGSDPNLLSKHFVLVADIDLDPNLPGGRVFDRAMIAPEAGTRRYPSRAFRGSFDGKGHRVLHLTIRAAAVRYPLGLFGEIGPDSQVRNLGVEQFSISGDSSWQGGLAGYNRGLVYHCHASGTVKSTGGEADGIGGLVGYNGWAGDLRRLARIVLCQTDCTVTTPLADLGGGCLAGRNRGEIRACRSSGAIAACMAGGLVGLNETVIADCSSSAAVSGWSAGGLVGRNDGAVSRSFSVGRVSGSSGKSKTGGLAGWNQPVMDDYYPGSIMDCFWDTETSGVASGPGGTGQTTAQMMDIQTYLAAGWDFVGERANGTADTWEMPKTKGYPFLAAVSDGFPPRRLAGAGTAQDPYRIATPEDLGLVRYYEESACYKLVAGLDLSGIRWTGSPIERFDGLFDGNGHVVSGMRIDGRGRIGLFGILGEHAKVKNLGVADANVTGSGRHSETGILTGLNYGRIEGCYATGKVRARPDPDAVVGGLVGRNAGKVARIGNCYTRCNVAGTSYLGGLMGCNGGEGVSYCYTYTVATTTAQGLPSGKPYSARLVGDLGGATTDSYFLKASQDGGLDNGAGTPLTDIQMKQQSSFTGWDFNKVWTIRGGKDYPRLRWEAAAK